MDTQDYLEIKVTVPDEETGDIIAAMVSDLGFDSLMYEDGQQKCYIQRGLYDEDAFEQTLEELRGTTGCELHFTVDVMPKVNWNQQWESTGFTPIECGAFIVLPYGSDCAGQSESSCEQQDDGDCAGHQAASSQQDGSDCVGHSSHSSSSSCQTDSSCGCAIQSESSSDQQDDGGCASHSSSFCSSSSQQNSCDQAGPLSPLYLNPQMAFGTGHHHTTFMMMLTMQSIDMRGASVMDLGCGTAVLAILAARLGAASVAGIDIDAVAVRSAQNNVSLNGLDFPVICGDATDLRPHSYDIILANIHKNIIIRDLPLYANALTPGGRLLVSGFYETDADEVLAAAAEQGITLADAQAVRTREGWCCISLKKS